MKIGDYVIANKRRSHVYRVAHRPQYAELDGPKELWLRVVSLQHKHLTEYPMRCLERVVVSFAGVFDV